MACIQTSFVNAAFRQNIEGKQKLTEMVAFFDSIVRGERKHEKGKPHEGGALRDHSNRGLSESSQKWVERKHYTTDSEQVDGWWNYCYGKGMVLYDWATVGLPAAVNRDAKYVYSRTFNYLLSSDNTWAAR
jgi:hypothetical protein